ncbi:MAG TPA: Ku protein, partial [Sedimentisphaerales bacterium]|nr:Ku protein [Sedimentisphaerales bacterium]
LKISLVSFPVRLYTAVGSAKKLALNQLHKQCRSRIHMDTCCPKHGKLARSEITKGYEYEKGKYIRSLSDCGNEDCSDISPSKKANKPMNELCQH